MIHDSGRTIFNPPKDGSPEAREEVWLWLYCQILGANFPVENFRGVNMIRDIDYFARPSGGVAGLREAHMGQYLLPAERLDWIADEKRQHNWLKLYFRQQLALSANYPFPPALLGRSLIIATLDIWKAGIAEKLIFVERMEQDWNQQKQRDLIFTWFQGEDEITRCKLAWNWLLDNKPQGLWGISPISSYEELLIYFDRPDGPFGSTPITDAEKRLIVNAIKRRGAQQKYREKHKNKKQCNLLLSDKSVKNLDKLAAKYGVSKAQIIEALIQYEIDKNVYLPERARVAAAWGEQIDYVVV